jgi:hypothetical protein
MGAPETQNALKSAMSACGVIAGVEVLVELVAGAAGLVAVGVGAGAG